MLKRFLMGCIVACSFAAHAVPVTFTGAQYNTSATATAQGVTESTSAANPPTALPLSSSATATGGTDFANAASAASAGLLTATAFSDSLAGAGSATAQARFAGTILGAGPLHILLDFDTLNLLDGGTAANTLTVLLTNTLGATTSTLFSGTFTSAGDYLLDYLTPLGSSSRLDLLLTSTAATGAGQLAQSFAQIAFSGTVPIAGTAPLLVAALVAAALALRPGRRRAASGAR